MAGTLDFDLAVDPTKAARNDLMSSLNRGEDVTKGRGSFHLTTVSSWIWNFSIKWIGVTVPYLQAVLLIQIRKDPKLLPSRIRIRIRNNH